MENKKYYTDIATKQDILDEMEKKKKLEKADKAAEFLQKRAELNKAPTRSEDYTSPLGQDKMVVQGKTERIVNPEVMEKTPIEKYQTRTLYRNVQKDMELEEAAKKAGKEIETIDYRDLRKQMPKSSRFGKIVSKVTKGVPVLGGIVAGLSALNSPDASAAVGDAVIPGGLEGAGMTNDPLFDKLQSGAMLTEEEKQMMMKRQALQNMAMRNGQK